MSLLDKGRQTVTVYPEVAYTDSDGNPLTRPSETGIVTNARVAPAAQSGTSARRAEDHEEGLNTEQMYKLRFPRSFKQVLGPEARISWNGELWGIYGHPERYDQSRRTAHREYTIRRA